MGLFDDVALPWLWPEEGGFVFDQGGATNLGITQAALDRWHARHPNNGYTVPTDVRLLTRDRAERIYADYWEDASCPDLPAPFALVAFDTAVNSGPPEACTLLQAAVGLPKEEIDGIIGPITLGAVAAAGERELEEYLWLRLDYDRAVALHQERHGQPGLRSLPVWCGRINRLRRLALAHWDAGT